MSGLLIEAHDWPEDIRPYVRDVEMHLLKRAILHYPSTLSTPASPGEITNPPACTDPGAAGTYAEDVA